MKELIEYYRLAQNDTVFAYDLAWEPSHGGYAQQQSAYGGLWNQWVPQTLRQRRRRRKRPGAARATTEQYRFGTHALSVPSMTQLTRDGDWRKLVADYRLFLDDLLREKYSAARAAREVH